MSDTHNAELPNNLPPCDVLLHCGDLTEDGTPSSISTALRSLGQIPAELKLVIAGNHEMSLDSTYYISEGGSPEDITKAQSLVSHDPTSEANKNGITFLNEGTHIFTLSSGTQFTIYTSPYNPAYGTSAFQYPSREDRFNPPSVSPAWAKSTGTETSIVPANVDIVMTHGPAKYILDSTSDGQSAGCEHLRRAIGRVRPRLFCCGHVHGGYGAGRLRFDDGERKIGKGEKGDGGDLDSIVPLAKEWVGKNQAKRRGYASSPPGSVEEWRRGGQTLVVNAAMQGEDGVLENVPWLVEMDL